MKLLTKIRDFASRTVNLAKFYDDLAPLGVAGATVHMLPLRF